MANEFKGGPWVGGWLIAAGAGAVAFGVCQVVGKFDLTPSIVIAGVLFVLVGLVLNWGVSRLDAAPGPIPAMPVEQKVAPVAVSAAPAPAKPAAVMAAPAVAAPVATPAKAKAAAPKAAAKPKAVVAAAPAGGRKPEALSAARGGKADDLKIIKGIGPALEKLCHKLGFFHFDQVANWTAEEIAWVDDNLEGFKGRVTRDRWVPQAKAIVNLGAAEFLAQLDAGKEF
jgi:predicted flap endonuclease-1-like 5' DNA nuclease